MKKFILWGVAALALASTARAADPSPTPGLMGSWAVDTARLPMPAEMRPQRVTLTFSGDGADRLRMRVEIIDPAGTQRLAEAVTPLDGTPTRLVANFEADTSATTMPRPEVLVMQLALNGSPASTRIYVVEADGQTMVETVAHFRPDGQPVLRKNHFTRLR